ncbi:hypothetical protein EHF33_14150 [Deinococcus psychrotolerans]|uniref:Uncharacterized protein n=1 Tax=Deinococcus psychrotolerans TaxID=2489213 RepID=A0A3G8YIH9_9DEIO|nr:hypothetical protein [Deinococcus psychrotolerans]AZI44057.1 hypothetical protein EHF33_14150 [Deinococcus psychrotolerans]
MKVTRPTELTQLLHAAAEALEQKDQEGTAQLIQEERDEFRDALIRAGLTEQDFEINAIHFEPFHQGERDQRDWERPDFDLEATVHTEKRQLTVCWLEGKKLGLLHEGKDGRVQVSSVGPEGLFYQLGDVLKNGGEFVPLFKVVEWSPAQGEPQLLVRDRAEAYAEADGQRTCRRVIAANPELKAVLVAALLSNAEHVNLTMDKVMARADEALLLIFSSPQPQPESSQTNAIVN